MTRENPHLCDEEERQWNDFVERANRLAEMAERLAEQAEQAPMGKENGD